MINNFNGYISDDDECPNPLCNHEGDLDIFSSIDIKPPIKINSIKDMIKIGKTYHCKKNRVYHGVDLEVVCRLVKPLTKLKNMIGMKDVKKSIINNIIFELGGFNVITKCNICQECIFGVPCIKRKNREMMHTYITGPPGVGKSEFCKILGEIYKELGILSNGRIHTAKRDDLIGQFLGQTTIKTQKFIDKCEGGIMLIDEVYSLGNEEGRDSYAKECIDCINLNLTEKRNFICIIAGYKDKIESCFFAYNEGLRRRFTFRYNIDKYSATELMKIFLLKINLEGWQTEFYGPKINTLEKFFKDNYAKFPHYGGDVETFFLNCKIMHSRRVIFTKKTKKYIIMNDIINGFKEYISNRGLEDKKSDIDDSIAHIYS